MIISMLFTFVSRRFSVFHLTIEYSQTTTNDATNAYEGFCANLSEKKPDAQLSNTTDTYY